MVSSTMILNVTEQTASTLPLTKPFEPVYEWNNETKAFSDRRKQDGVGRFLWQSEALISMGYGFQTTPVKVRVWASNQPRIQVDPSKLASLVETAPKTKTEVAHG